MIGRITPQVCEYEVVSLLHAGSKKKVRQVRAGIVERMKSGGIIRPHLASFLTRVKQGVPSTEFFVYTASDDAWAKFIVPCIEEAIGFKFCRPIFTRKHCMPVNGDYKKSIVRVAPLILKQLKPSYPALAGARAQDIVAGAMLIDNNPIVMERDEADRHLRCATYNYAYFNDVLARVDPDILLARFSRVIPLLAGYGLFPQRVPAADVTSAEQFVAMYYGCLAESAQASLRDAGQSRRDRLWAVLGDLLTSPSYSSDRITPAVVTSLRAQLRIKDADRR